MLVVEGKRGALQRQILEEALQAQLSKKRSHKKLIRINILDYFQIKFLQI